MKDVRTLLVPHLCKFMLSMFKDTFANVTIAKFRKFHRNFEDMSKRKLVRLFTVRAKILSALQYWQLLCHFQIFWRHKFLQRPKMCTAILKPVSVVLIDRFALLDYLQYALYEGLLTFCVDLVERYIDNLFLRLRSTFEGRRRVLKFIYSGS